METAVTAAVISNLNVDRKGRCCYGVLLRLCCSCFSVCRKNGDETDGSHNYENKTNNVTFVCCGSQQEDQKRENLQLNRGAVAYRSKDRVKQIETSV